MIQICKYHTSEKKNPQNSIAHIACATWRATKNRHTDGQTVRQWYYSIDHANICYSCIKDWQVELNYLATYSEPGLHHYILCHITIRLQDQQLLVYLHKIALQTSKEWVSLSAAGLHKQCNRQNETENRQVFPMCQPAYLADTKLLCSVKGPAF